MGTKRKGEEPFEELSLSSTAGCDHPRNWQKALGETPETPVIKPGRRINSERVESAARLNPKRLTLRGKWWKTGPNY